MEVGGKNACLSFWFPMRVSVVLAMDHAWISWLFLKTGRGEQPLALFQVYIRYGSLVPDESSGFSGFSLVVTRLNAFPIHQPSLPFGWGHENFAFQTESN